MATTRTTIANRQPTLRVLHIPVWLRQHSSNRLSKVSPLLARRRTQTRQPRVKAIRHAAQVACQRGDYLIVYLEKGSRRPATIIDCWCEDESITSTTEHVSQASPSEKLLQDFYRRWLKIEKPILREKDKQLADELAEIYGYEKLNGVLRKVISTLKVSFPETRSFTAAQRTFEQLASKAQTAQAATLLTEANKQGDERSQQQKIRNREKMKRR